MMSSTLEKVKQEHGITLKFQDDVYERLKLLSCQNLSMGGRGIGNNIELYFINPLARVLFEREATPGTAWLVGGLRTEGDLCELDLSQTAA